MDYLQDVLRSYQGQQHDRQGREPPIDSVHFPANA